MEEKSLHWDELWVCLDNFQKSADKVDVYKSGFSTNNLRYFQDFSLFSILDQNFTSILKTVFDEIF